MANVKYHINLLVYSRKNKHFFYVSATSRSEISEIISVSIFGRKNEVCARIFAAHSCQKAKNFIRSYFRPREEMRVYERNLESLQKSSLDSSSAQRDRKEGAALERNKFAFVGDDTQDIASDARWMKRSKTLSVLPNFPSSYRFRVRRAHPLSEEMAGSFFAWHKYPVAFRVCFSWFAKNIKNKL